MKKNTFYTLQQQSIFFKSNFSSFQFCNLNFSEVAASIVNCTSDNLCNLYKLNNTDIDCIEVLSEHKEKIIGCRFSGIDNNLLYTGSSDGIFKVWDIRNPSKSSVTLTGNKMCNIFNNTIIFKI